MRLVDTSAWVEWLVGSPTGKRIASAIPQRDIWLIPTIVQLELAKWLNQEMSEDAADQVLTFTRLCVVAPLDSTLALAASEVSRLHSLASADILTCDAHFRGLPGVIFTPKDTITT